MRVPGSKYKKYATGGRINSLDEDGNERQMPVLSENRKGTIEELQENEGWYQGKIIKKAIHGNTLGLTNHKQLSDWYIKNSEKPNFGYYNFEDFKADWPTAELDSGVAITGEGGPDYFMDQERKPEKLIKIPPRSIEQMPTSEMDGPKKIPPFELMKNNSKHFTVHRQGVHSGTYPKGEDGKVLIQLKDQAGRFVWKGSQTEYKEKYGDWLERGDTEYGERKKHRLYKKYQQTSSFDDPEFGGNLGPIITSGSDRLGANSNYDYQTKIQGDLVAAERENFLANNFKGPAGNFIPYNTDPATIVEDTREDPSFIKKVTNTLANPVAAFGYSARGQEVPYGRIVADENNFDMALGMVNPFKWGEYGGLAYDAFSEGDILGGTLNTLGALPFIPSAIAGTKHIIPHIANKTSNLKRIHALKTELKTYNNQGLFNSVSKNGLSNSQLNILAKNENLANNVIQSAIKNSDQVTAYRGVNVQGALQNPTAVKAMVADGIDVANHSDVAKWLSTRVHTGGETDALLGGIGYRAGGGGSEHFKFGDFAYTMDRATLLKSNSRVQMQAKEYGPWVNKLRIKGAEDLIDFSSGTRGDWVNKLQNYVPYKVKVNNNSVAPNIDIPFLDAGGVAKINPNKSFVTFNADGSIMNPSLRSTTSPDNMFFGPRGKQIFESWGNPRFNPQGFGTGPNAIYKHGGHIRTDNLKRKL